MTAAHLPICECNVSADVWRSDEMCIVKGVTFIIICFLIFFDINIGAVENLKVPENAELRAASCASK